MYKYINIDNIVFIITIIIGLIFGVIIGYIFFMDIKYIGPNSNEIVKKIYYDNDGKKYKLIPKISICPVNYSMNKLLNSNFKEIHY